MLLVYEELGVRGLSVEYRLAPEHLFPAQVEDAKNIFLGLLAEGYQPNQIALTGDSAGGALSVATTLALKSDNKPLPGALVLISPGLADVKNFGYYDSHLTLNDWDPFETVDLIKQNREKYSGALRQGHPLMSPIYGNFERFPPMLIQIGTRDLLLSDAALLAKKARREGVEVTLDVWEGMWHAWHLTWPDVPEAREACSDIARFLIIHLNSEQMQRIF